MKTFLVTLFLAACIFALAFLVVLFINLVTWLMLYSESIIALSLIIGAVIYAVSSVVEVLDS